jgi:hypothetical protein
MTNEELDQARADEARRIVDETGRGRATAIAARLAREGWMPVDPLLIEAREIFARQFEEAQAHGAARQCRDGKYDSHPHAKRILAALKRGIEIGKGKTGE